MRTRYLVGYTAILAMLPYLILKTTWILGGTLGVDDPATMGSALYVGANLASGGMEVVGVLVALALTHRWGLRLPAALVVFPMWVATGLLAPIALITPIGVFAASGAPDGFLRPWVYRVVYGGFTVEGLALLVAFVLYARARWGQVLRGGAPGATAALQVLLGNALAGVALLLGAVELYWGLGGTVGMPRAFRGVDGFTCVLGALAVVTAGAVWLLVHRVGRSWWALAGTWIGSGSMFGWGLYLFLIRPNASAGKLTALTDLVPLSVVDLVKVVTGTLVAMVAAFLLVERARGISGPAPRTGRDSATPA